MNVLNMTALERDARTGKWIASDSRVVPPSEGRRMTLRNRKVLIEEVRLPEQTKVLQ